MSVSPFKDTVTLWHCISSESGQTYIRRVIERVKCTVTEKNSGKDTAVLFIPLYGKRDIRYMTSDEFGTGSGHGDAFTVKVGDRLVCGTILRLGTSRRFDHGIFCDRQNSGKPQNEAS